MNFFKKAIFLIFLFFPIFALAARGWEISYPTISNIPSPTLSFPLSAQDIANYVQYIFYFAIFTGIILALTILVLAGFRYLYSAGNPQIQLEAKSQITHAFFGLILLLASLTLLVSIRPEFSQINPPTLQGVRLNINILRRIRIRMPWQQIATQLYPSLIPLEETYPTVEGFRPEFIPFETSVAPQLYPLEKLLARYGKYLYDFSFIIGVILALLFLLIGGFRYLTSAGNISQAADARNQILSALLGLLLLLASYLILVFFRPEFAIINPKELEETEIELEPGVYLCQNPMNPEKNLDPLIKVLRCQDLKRLIETYSKIDPETKKQSYPEDGEYEKRMKEFKNKYDEECFFPKRMKKEISAFLTQCLLIQNSETLPPWMVGEPVDIEKIKEELDKLKSENAISDDEYQEIVQEWEEYNNSLNTQSSFYIYINGPYGLVLHEERDFKGPGVIILKHNFLDTVKFDESEPSKFISFPTYQHHIGAHRPLYAAYGFWFPKEYNYRIQYNGNIRSVTLFEDKIADCVLKTIEGPKEGHGPSIGTLYAAARRWVYISECLEIKSKDDLTFSFYNLPDFGALEEKAEKEPGYYVVTLNETYFNSLIKYEDTQNFQGFSGYLQSYLSENVQKTQVQGQFFPFSDPTYSLRLPAEEKWIVVVGYAPTTDPGPADGFQKIYVLNKSERNFEDTYVRSFCLKNNLEYPCITHFFAYPGKIIRKR